jgi:hypothetical protein
VQLYQLSMQVKRLRGTVQRLWVWIGVLALVAGFSAPSTTGSPSPEILGRSLVLGGAGARTYTVKPRAEGLGIEVRDGGASKVADVVLRTEDRRIWIERAGRSSGRTPDGVDRPDSRWNEAPGAGVGRRRCTP